MKSKSNPLLRASRLTLLAQLALLGTVNAQTIWDGGGTPDTNINTAANWNNNILPANDGSVQVSFGTAGSVATFNTDYFFQGVTLNRVSTFALNSSGGNVILRSSNSGSTYTLTMSSGAGAIQTINAPLRINTSNGDANKLFVVRNNNTSNALEVKGGIALATGSSTNYNLRYEGVTGSVTRMEGAVTGMAAIQQGANAWAGSLVFAGSRTMGTNITAATSGSGVGAVSGSIVLGETVSDVQSWGSITLNNALKVVVGGDVTVTGITGNATTSLVGTTQAGALTSKLTVNLASSGTIGNTIYIGGAGAGENNLSLIKTGVGTLTLNGSGTYSGGTTLVDGGGSGSFGIALGANNALGTGPLVIGTANTGANGARLRMAGFNQTVSTLSSGATTNARVIENFGATNSTLTVNGAASGIYAGFLRDRSTSSATATGNLGLIKEGAGTLTLSNTSNQYTGATVINGGVLEVVTLNNGGIVKTVTSTASSATVTMTNTNGITTGMTFVAANLPTGNNVSTVDSGTNITINTAAGILTGSSTAHFGTASSIGLSTNAAANLVFGGGTLRYTGGNTTTDRNFTINNGATAGWDVANSESVLTLTGGAASSTGNLSKLGAGTLALFGTNFYTGDTTISNGELRLTSATAINGTSGITVSSGRLSLDGGISTGSGKSVTINGTGGNFFGALQGNSGTNEWAGDVVIGTTTGTRIGVNAGQLTVSGIISGSTSVNGLTFRPNSGTTLVVSGVNTYAGDTTILSATGVVKLDGGNDRLPTGTRLIFGSGSTSGILDLNGRNQQVAGLSVGQTSGPNTNEIRSTAAATLTVNTAASSPSSYAGIITGGTALTKIGADTLTLTGANTYTGATTVSAGVLAINGSLANTSTTVGNTGTLRGNGSIGGSVTVQNGGTIASGNSIDSLATGALSLEASATFAYEINKDAAAAVAGDLTAVTGNLTLDLGNAALLTIVDGGGGSWNIGEKLTLISYTGSWNGGLFNYSGTLADDSTFNFSDMEWLFNYNDTSAGSNYISELTGSSFVTMTAIPEPNVAALLSGLGTLTLLRRRSSASQEDVDS